jgi:hypothetical protein
MDSSVNDGEKETPSGRECPVRRFLARDYVSCR